MAVRRCYQRTSTEAHSNNGSSSSSSPNIKARLPFPLPGAMLAARGGRDRKEE